jgi:hypothetical protein
VPARFIGTSRSIVARSNAASAIPESMIPGATALTVTPRLASSRASALVALLSAPLAAA